MCIRGIAVLSFLLLLSTTAALPAQYRQSRLPTTPVMPVVRVANGVRKLQHDGTAFARATQLALSGPPVTVIGGANGDPDYDLTFAWNVALLSDGRVATLAPIGNKFYLFGADGRGQRTLARPGKGPGELMRPSGAIRLAGDTIFVADDGNRSLSWFVADKGVVRSKARGADGGGELGRAHGVLRNGGVLLSSAGRVQDGEPDRITRPLASAGIAYPDGQLQMIAKIPDLEVVKMSVTVRGARSRVFVTPNNTMWVLDPVAPGDMGWTATAFRSDGAMVGRLHAAGSGHPVTFGDDRVVISSEDGDGITTLTVRKIAVVKVGGRSR